jgi:DNA polymerase-3 subunit delta'
VTLEELVLHDATRSHAVRFLANPAHALLLTGADGIGKTAIAKALLAQLLETANVDVFPHFMKISLEGNSISIESIRGLQQFLRLKTTGTNTLRRAVLIEHAQGLTTEAQNAYLKLLEEPPADTIMILTADSPRSLLPTILSRVQTINVSAPGEEQLKALMQASGKDEATCRQAFFMSGGLPGLLAALLAGDEEHPLLTSVNQAKAILQKNQFERLALVDTLSKQKESAQGIVSALERISEAMLAQSAAKGDTGRIKQWHLIRKNAAAAREALEQSANAKLTLSNLFLHL